MADDRKAPPPTLEQLIRVKRAERPDAAFWASFDRSWEKRRLCALVEPKKRVTWGTIALWSTGAVAACFAVFSFVLVPQMPNGEPMAKAVEATQAVTPVVFGPIEEILPEAVAVSEAVELVEISPDQTRFIENQIPATVTPSPRFRAAPTRATLSATPAGYVRDYLPIKASAQPAVWRGHAF